MEGVPEVASALSWGVLWRASESEYTRANVRLRSLTERSLTDRSPVLRGAIRDAIHARDVFAAICRLIERVSADAAIKARLREIATAERAASADDGVAIEAAE